MFLKWLAAHNWVQRISMFMVGWIASFVLAVLLTLMFTQSLAILLPVGIVAGIVCGVLAIIDLSKGERITPENGFGVLVINLLLYGFLVTDILLKLGLAGTWLIVLAVLGGVVLAASLAIVSLRK